MSVEDKVKDLVTSILEEYPNLFLVEMSIVGNSGHQRVRVLIDGDPNFSIDQCAAVSRRLGFQIEEDDLFDSKYTLEVSSPGVDQPLKLSRQYLKNKGRELKVELLSGEILKGQLTEMKDNAIHLVLKNKKEEVKKTILLSDIKKSNVLISFK
ncbi:MAG: ribosome maturation factor RimP [Cyclobacteriaceae bacterium]|nr:ribosome maturation factor RimP [Cyclobacteriaceae bacterium HetDA_MAG_MS6]